MSASKVKNSEAMRHGSLPGTFFAPEKPSSRPPESMKQSSGPERSVMLFCVCLVKLPGFSSGSQGEARVVDGNLRSSSVHPWLEAES